MLMTKNQIGVRELLCAGAHDTTMRAPSNSARPLTWRKESNGREPRDADYIIYSSILEI